jgi:hypothetical protein
MRMARSIRSIAYRGIPVASRPISRRSLMSELGSQEPSAPAARV